MKIANVPYYENPDDTHCYQAAIRMVLQYFMPKKQFTWDNLDKLTAKDKNLWTWPMQGLINLKNMGFEVINMENFDYEKFIKSPEKYLQEEYGKDVVKEIIKNSIIPQAVKAAKNFLKIFGSQKKIPSLANIKRFVDKNYLVIVNINYRSLSNKKGYEGHFIVISGYDDNHFYANDPDGKRNQKIDLETFKKAWEYPNKKACNIQAFKLKN